MTMLSAVDSAEYLRRRNETIFEMLAGIPPDAGVQLRNIADVYLVLQVGGGISCLNIFARLIV